jgi:hypothetical protein
MRIAPALEKVLSNGNVGKLFFQIRMRQKIPGLRPVQITFASSLTVKVKSIVLCNVWEYVGCTAPLQLLQLAIKFAPQAAGEIEVNVIKNEHN